MRSPGDPTTGYRQRAQRIGIRASHGKRIWHEYNELPLPITISILIATACLDFWGVLSSGSPARYLILPTVILVSIMIDGSTAPRPRIASRVNLLLLSLFCVYMLTVYLYATIMGTIDDESTVLVASLIPVFLGPALYTAFGPHKQRNTRIIRSMPHLFSSLFGVLSIVNVFAAPPKEPPTFFNHETVFIAILILCLPKGPLSRFAKIVVSIALILSMVHYASATTVITLVAGLVVYLCLRFWTRTSGFLAVSIVFVIGAFFLSRFDEFLGSFYEQFGRVNNTDTRQGLWNQAIEIWNANLLFGSFGEQPITALANIRGVIQPVPFHNSFLSLGVYGGVIAAALFAVSIVALLYRALNAEGYDRYWAAVWAPPLLAATLAMTMNPMLESLSTSLPFYTLIVFGLIAVKKQDKDA